MKEVKIKLYTIDELKKINEKAYKKIIETESERTIELRFDYAQFDCKDRLKDKYNLDIDKKNIYYSISYCQGDGFSFIDNNILSYTNIKNKNNLNVFEKWIIDNLNDNDFNMLLEYLNCGYNLNIIKTSHHYEHCHTCAIDYEYFYSSDNPNYIDDMNDFINKLCNKLFNEVYINICDDLEKFLYSFYDVDESDIIESLRDNNYLYLKDGSIYTEGL